ncbi:hypothetical protein C7I87_02460 [Mesorhizobium sp. SARCC-RB16n]|uniref:hypothetical protein n=1 Tax=Mesorhizobium sp. SARCC-RB16n TaxID=2116687 RepID=UPI00122EF7AF|nr:hypothetical protein [Mesorhizobium sp. SARCC-RB16n]KAA3452269.1 hypothetical protein C7I87_02460 [Mesorhizobium sp. SARCC-RB16n]
MTKLSGLGPPIKGKPHEPTDEGDHFYQARSADRPVDMRDLRQVIWHEQPRHKPLKPELVKDP